VQFLRFLGGYLTDPDKLAKIWMLEIRTKLTRNRQNPSGQDLPCGEQTFIGIIRGPYLGRLQVLLQGNGLLIRSGGHLRARTV
jgi:hypothetical protein